MFESTHLDKLKGELRTGRPRRQVEDRKKNSKK